MSPFAKGFLGWAGETAPPIATSLAAWALLWSMGFWLYRRGILIKI